MLVYIMTHVVPTLVCLCLRLLLFVYVLLARVTLYLYTFLFITESDSMESSLYVPAKLNYYKIVFYMFLS